VRPAHATTAAGWSRQVSRALTLLLIAVLLALLLRAGQNILGESERIALDLAERNLRNLVWLEARRVTAEEGVAGLRLRAGQDPRPWAEQRIGTRHPVGPPAGPLSEWAEQRWSFDADRGELVYHPAWMRGGERRWRVELREDGVDSPTPGLARDLFLVRRDRPRANP